MDLTWVTSFVCHGSMNITSGYVKPSASSNETTSASFDEPSLGRRMWPGRETGQRSASGRNDSAPPHDGPGTTSRTRDVELETSLANLVI